MFAVLYRMPAGVPFGFLFLFVCHGVPKSRALSFAILPSG